MSDRKTDKSSDTYNEEEIVRRRDEVFFKPLAASKLTPLKPDVLFR
jgi:hypothetical protein